MHKQLARDARVAACIDISKSLIIGATNATMSRAKTVRQKCGGIMARVVVRQNKNVTVTHRGTPPRHWCARPGLAQKTFPPALHHVHTPLDLMRQPMMWLIDHQYMYISGATPFLHSRSQPLTVGFACATLYSARGVGISNMPMLSEAQRRLMYAVLDGKSDKVPTSVAQEYVKHDKGGKLPEKKDGRKRTHKSK